MLELNHQRIETAFAEKKRPIAKANIRRLLIYSLWASDPDISKIASLLNIPENTIQPDLDYVTNYLDDDYTFMEKEFNDQSWHKSFTTTRISLVRELFLAGFDTNFIITFMGTGTAGKDLQIIKEDLGILKPRPTRKSKNSSHISPPITRTESVA